MTRSLPILALALAGALPLLAPASLHAQQPAGRPEDTEVWTPVPRVVIPGRANTAPPSDAVVLFDGRSLAGWVSLATPRSPRGGESATACSR